MSAADVRFILDFDSTLVRVETLELMAELKPDGAKLNARIKELTDAAMGGSLSFRAALEQRLKLPGATIQEMEALWQEAKAIDD